MARLLLIIGLLVAGCGGPAEEPATAEPVTAEPTPAPSPAPTPEPVEVSVRVISDRCGENVLELAEAPEPVAEATVEGNTVQLAVSGYVAVCAPGPQLDGSRTGSTVVLSPRDRDPAEPVTACACVHELKVEVSDLPQGSWTIQVQTGSTRPVHDGTRWVEAPVQAEVSVVVGGG